jgi:hypothetical protein
MTVQEKLIAKYGNPMLDVKVFEVRNLTLWDVPLYINTHIPAIPNKIYCNKDLIEPLHKVFLSLIETGLSREIKTWDGCYNVRFIRGSKTVLSIHSFALAIDMNASHNPLGLDKDTAKANGLKPFSLAFDDMFRSNGFKCGIDFKRGDGMHFEYTTKI